MITPEGATAHRVVQREDLVAPRFDRVFTTFFRDPDRSAGRPR
ncbi:hypothetical protein [Lentzea xinjiangensis]|nr:hypothetical protein [Lentzea xinjiangensis]